MDLRLWPGVLIVVLQWLARLVAPVVVPGPLEELMVRGVSSLLGTLAIVIWWLFFSRAAGRSEKFDIEAKMESGAGTDQWQLMLQTLLAERFKLAWHREQQQTAIYALVVAKNGPKLTPTRCERAGPSGHCGMSATPSEIIATGVSMAQMATRLSRSIGRIVIDETGLTGSFDIQLEWTPEDRFTEPGASAGASIFAALQDQLGLKLESRRAPVETLIIDHAERPSEN